MGFQSAARGYPAIAQMPQVPQTRSNQGRSAGAGKSTEIRANNSPDRRVPARYAPARESSSGSSGSGVQPRRGRRRPDDDPESESSSDSELPDTASIQSDHTEDHEEDGTVATEEPVAEVPQASKTESAKPIIDNKRHGKWKFGVFKGVRISAFFRK